MARLLAGASDAIVAENVRALIHQGLSEAEAVRRARQHAKDGSSAPSARAKESRGPASPAPRSTASQRPYEPSGGRCFVVVTKDYSGLGWAAALDREGEQVVLAVENPEEEPDARAQFDKVGEGWLTTVPLSQAVKQFTTPDHYWLFATNDYTEHADQLRARGIKVWGTTALSEKLEHDRHYACEVAEQAGLKPPETHEFTTVEEGLAFLDEHAETAWVLKPDAAEANHLTFVPSRRDDRDANRETYTYLAHLDAGLGTYILQERVQGTELNVEVWVEEGEPHFAFVTLEAKRKNTGDLGEMAGCAGDLLWAVPVDHPLVEQTVGWMLDFYHEQHYTGPADVNVILTAQGPRFLEVCNRCGYNAYPTLLLGLAQMSLGDIFAGLMDGQMADAPGWFRSGYAASTTLFLDHPREGLPLHVDPSVETRYYPFDGYRADDQELLLAGYSTEVGILVGTGQTPEVALRGVLRDLQTERVAVPDAYYRTDLAERGYPNAILDRVDVLKAKGWA